jgi:type I restriction enzyme S subunit
MSTGKIGVVPAGFEGNINRHLARVRLGPRMRSDFFVHLWRSPQFYAYATRQSVGSTKPELTIGALKAIRVPCPPLAEQEEIAGVLSRVEHAEDELQGRARAARALTRSVTDE